MTVINRQPTAALRVAAQPLVKEALNRFGPGPADFRTALSGCRPKCFAPNEVIYRERDRGSRIFLIRRGLVKVLTYLPSGQTRIVRLHSNGHWIGLERLLDQPCGHTAIAVGELEVDAFPVPSLHRLHHEDPDTLGQLLLQWHLDLAQADKWISEFSTGGIKSRVARLLTYLAELEHGPGARTVELLTVTEMAEILGVTQESVSRVVAAFKRCGILCKADSCRRESFRLDIEMLQRESAA